MALSKRHQSNTGLPILKTTFQNGQTIEELYPREFLRSVKASGLPLSNLSQKPGAPVMLLRNLDPEHGLCSGTRCRIVEMRPHVLRIRVISGTHAGYEAFIPRMKLQPSDSKLPFTLERHQFPIRLCFAMAINKSQGTIHSYLFLQFLITVLGQSLANVGLDLRLPVFSHGQLYVALSRCTTKSKIKILYPEFARLGTDRGCRNGALSQSRKIEGNQFSSEH